MLVKSIQANKEKIMVNENSPKKEKAVVYLIFILASIIINVLFALIINYILKFSDIIFPYGFVLASITFILSIIFLFKSSENIKNPEYIFSYILIFFLFYLGIGALSIGILLFIYNKNIIYAYDATFLGLFCLFTGIFLLKNKGNLKREGIMYLYRTRFGIKLIDYIGTKYKKTLAFFSYLAVISGYILMSSMIYFLYMLLKIYLFQPKIVQAIKIPPFMPLVPYVPELFKVSFLPKFYFTYWIIAIATIAIFHEFSHGIFAKRYGVKIKTTGFGFLGPFLAAFVEPDEKEMEKKPKFQQITVLSAGTFANIILTVVFLVLLIGFFKLSYVPAGSSFDSYAYVSVPIGMITTIDGMQLNNQTSAEILELINKNNIKDDIVLGDEKSSINMTDISASGQKFLIPLNDLKTQLQKNPSSVTLYYDMPAIRVQLKGVLIKIGDTNIITRNDVEKAMSGYMPNDTIKIITKGEDGNIINEVTLNEDPNNKSRAMIGIAYAKQKQTFLSSIFKLFNFFNEDGTYYEPIWNKELTIFIRDLLWWLVLINFSVALINMWPVAIFDGGRAFMLTIWAITKSEKFAKIAFRFMSYLILASLILIVYGYFSAMLF